MDDVYIKSALEIAREKVEKLGTATEEERLRWKYVPEGEKLAAKYLKQECNLVVESSKYPESVRKYIAQGAEDILIRNIGIPKDDTAKKRNRQAMDGLKALKSDKVAVENVFSRMRRIFEHYQEHGERQKKQAYESLRADFEAKVQAAVQQQMGSFAGVKIDVERQPQFQEEWRRVLSQLDAQYVMLLDEYKRELRAKA
jgi:hypothetical protein